MSHFGDLIRGGKQTPEVAPPAPVDTTPASVEPDEEVNFNTMTKIELEEFGRELGIELDRRHNKKTLVKELEDELKKQE